MQLKIQFYFDLFQPPGNHCTTIVHYLQITTVKLIKSFLACVSAVIINVYCERAILCQQRTVLLCSHCSHFTHACMIMARFCGQNSRVFLRVFPGFSKFNISPSRVFPPGFPPRVEISGISNLSATVTFQYSTATATCHVIA